MKEFSKTCVECLEKKRKKGACEQGRDSDRQDAGIDDETRGLLTAVEDDWGNVFDHCLNFGSILLQLTLAWE